jgi:muramoyltetrapeptide carboxypeptidase
MSGSFARPGRLRRGDRVALAAPAGPVDRERLAGAAALLESRGFEVLLREDAHARERYFAGSDARRLDELAGALADPSIAAVFLARGGYGGQRILSALEPSRDLAPKPVVGFSDNTALLARLHLGFGWCVLHGPHPQAEKADELDEVLACLGFPGEPLLPRYGNLRVWREGGAVTGPVGGGCLSLLSTSVGTSYGWAAEGRIFFIEDVGEAPYRLDRMLHHLSAAGALDGAAAVVFGDLAAFAPAGTDIADVEAVIEDFAARMNCPVVSGLPCGHTTPNRPLPFGPAARLDSARGELVFLEAMVR